VLIYIGVVIAVIVVCVLLKLEFNHAVLLVIFVGFSLLLINGMKKETNRTKYKCIEGNLYMKSDNLINQNKKCKVDSEIIYQIEENGDLVKMDIER
jgi:hypothetical protein